MEKLKIKIFGSILLIVSLTTCFPLLLLSAERGTLKIGPARFEFLLPPGYRHTDALIVTNTLKHKVRLKAEVYDFDVDDRGNMVVLKTNTIPLSCASWIKFNPREFTLSPGEKQIVRFTIRAPENTIAGEHRCIIIFGTPPVAEPGVVGIVLNIGVVVYAAVPEIERSCEVKNISEISYKDGVLKFITQLYNSGNARFRGRGKYEIKNDKGEVIFEDIFPDFTVMPERNLLIPLEKEIEISPGSYNLSLELKERVRGNPPSFGKEVNFKIDEEDRE